MISEHTRRSLEQVERDVDRDYFMNADEARDYGLVDSVLASRPVDSVKAS